MQSQPLIASVLPPHPVPARRWLAAISLIFVLQLGFIFWLSGPEPMASRTTAPAPAIRLVDGALAENLALTDPTLFALPHVHGFSGLSWLKVPQLAVPSFDWTVPPQFLPLPAQGLDELCRRFIQTPSLNSPADLRRLEPQSTLPDVSPLALAPEHSGWRLEGALAQRRLLTGFELRSWQHTELLTNSIVQMVVDAAGAPVSLTLLPPGSGLAEADQTALTLARGARFEPLPAAGPQTLASALARLTWGRIIFEWHTMPPPPTKTAASP